ncbi:hypothetical protein [Amycolatopsis sp. CA-230715]|uniref:hypothetical protein n=1 Tax=Amycolatopsis sp. CA-230715 TaxID=2745196 RepID=UPI001C02DB41|nr:hypothetical protein [Amycolatopsis sp. CA-230715]QWF78751.1 hypothetical protein HUW46_02149 [Amycolatopsis sp. CA-230715]
MTGQAKPVLYGMRARVLRPWPVVRRDASRLISGNPEVWEVFVVGDGVPRSRPVRPNMPLVLLYVVAGDIVTRPADRCPPDRNGYMASGAYVVHSSCYEDWIGFFGHSLPIPLHDYMDRRRDAR